MGISLNPIARDTNSISNMKYFVAALVFLAALVAGEPEAEAEAGYGGYGYYGRPYGYGLGYRGYGYGRGYYNRGYYGSRYAYRLHKREADAEPLKLGYKLLRPVYSHPVVHHPVVHHPVVLRAPAASSFQHVSTPAATYGIHQLHKREAEAEAEPEAHYYGNYYGAYPYRYGGYRYGYPGYGYGYRSYYGRYHY